MKIATKQSNYGCPLIRGKSCEEEREICLSCRLPKCFYDKQHGELTKAEWGRLGGLVTASRYGHDTLSEWGRKGGRPRLATLEEIFRQQQLLKAQENKKEVTDTPSKLPGSLKELKKLYLHQRRSTGNIQTKRGKVDPSFPPKEAKTNGKSSS